MSKQKYKGNHPPPSSVTTTSVKTVEQSVISTEEEQPPKGLADTFVEEGEGMTEAPLPMENTATEEHSVIGQWKRPLYSIEENRTLMRGGTLPMVEVKSGTDPLIVEMLNFLEKIQSGGAINPWALMAVDECACLIMKVRESIRVQVVVASLKDEPTNNGTEG